MNNCTDFSTSIKLEEAGFERPFAKTGQNWYYKEHWLQVAGRDGTTFNVFCPTAIVQTIEDWAFLHNDMAFAPNAIQIINQMPPVTTINKTKTDVWRVTFPASKVRFDFVDDECPHKAAALAFIAWKRGKRGRTNPLNT